MSSFVIIPLNRLETSCDIFYGIRNDGTISDEIRITIGLLSEINWPVCSVTAVLEQETDDGETNSFLSSFVEWDKAPSDLQTPLPLSEFSPTDQRGLPYNDH